MIWCFATSYIILLLQVLPVLRVYSFAAMKFGSFCFCIPGSKKENKQEDSDSSSNKAKSHKKYDKSGKKEGNVDDADQGVGYQGATTTTMTDSSDAGMAAAVAVGATTSHASAVE